MKNQLPKADYLFEVSWEVCHQVGGIYTVIKSKASSIYDAYLERYFLLGPYMEKEAQVKFEMHDIPEEFIAACQSLKGQGINCYFGKWPIGHVKVNTILIDFAGYMDKKNEIKKEMWDNFKVDSLNADEKYDSFMVWAYVTGKLLEGVRNSLKGTIIAHFHEYIAGPGLLYLKKNKVNIATVFTTHATYLGRTLAGKGDALYARIKKINPQEEAYKHNIQARHLLEKATAEHADCFTTVSDITGLEAEFLLGKKPNLILPNGFDSKRFPSLEERAIKHNVYKKKIFDFVKVFFFPYYIFDVESSLIYFISGRYEFRNKGIDIYIKALALLNKKLKKENGPTVISFLWIPAKVQGINTELLTNKIYYEGIENFTEASLHELKSSIINSIIMQKLPTTKELFSDNFEYEMRKKMMEFKKEGSPLISTHNINPNDAILQALRKAGLNNSKEDKVKVIYYPIYLTGADGLIDLNYYDAIMGCHLGLFPSYYEPWGYTPVETAALGVNSLTTDLSGFGKYLAKSGPHKGIVVLKRYKVEEREAASKLARVMHDFSRLHPEERIRRKIDAKHLADTTDWERMVKYYHQAYGFALGKLK
jgi:glycogen(starch) synthase